MAQAYASEAQTCALQLQLQTEPFATTTVLWGWARGGLSTSAQYNLGPCVKNWGPGGSSLAMLQPDPQIPRAYIVSVLGWPPTSVGNLHWLQWS